MNRTYPIALAVFLLIFLVACAPATPDAQEPTELPQATPAGQYHPLTTETGVQVVDRVLASVASGDQQQMNSVIEFTSAPCTTQDGLGGPPKCREGEAEGTTTNVLPFLGGEGSFLRDDEIEQWNGIRAAGLYAIYEVNQAVITAEQYYPIGSYVIVYVREGNQPAVAVRVGESGIVRVDEIFDASPESLNAMIEQEASDVILAPMGR